MGGPEIANNNDSKNTANIKSESSRTKEEIINFANHEKKSTKENLKNSLLEGVIKSERK